MAVFDIAANQIKVDPVGNYYKGKALRAGIKSQELANEAQEFANETAPDRENRAERSLQVDEGGLEQRIKEYESLVGEKRAKRSAFDMYSAVSDVNSQFQQGNLTEDQALSVASERMLEYANNLPDEVKEQADAIKAKIMDSDGLTMQEWQSIGQTAQAGAKYYGFIDAPPEPKIVSRGAALVDAQGNEIYKNEIPAGEDGDGKLSAKEAEIQEWMRLGYSREDAAKFAYDKVKIEQNPSTGRVIRKDEITGRVTEVTISGEEVPAIGPEPGKTLWDLSEYATGPESAAKAALNVPLAWAGLPTDQKVTSARQTFKTTNQNFIRALAINPRFPVAEQERIREEINLLPGLMDSPALMRDRMVSINDDLRVRQLQAEQDMSNPDLSDEARKNASMAATEIKNYLAIMGAPPADKDIPAVIRDQGNVDAYKKMSPRMRQEYLDTFN